MTTTLTVGLVMLLSLPGLILSFQPLIALKSTTHRDITQRAVLRKTAEVCRDIAASNGWPFSLTVSWFASQKHRVTMKTVMMEITDILQLTERKKQWTDTGSVPQRKYKKLCVCFIYKDMMSPTILTHGAVDFKDRLIQCLNVKHNFLDLPSVICCFFVSRLITTCQLTRCKRPVPLQTRPHGSSPASGSIFRSSLSTWATQLLTWGIFWVRSTILMMRLSRQDEISSQQVHFKCCFPACYLFFFFIFYLLKKLHWINSRSCTGQFCQQMGPNEINAVQQWSQSQTYSECIMAVSFFLFLFFLLICSTDKRRFQISTIHQNILAHISASSLCTRLTLCSLFCSRGLSAVKASVRKGRYFRGKWTLGQVCHTLQVRTMIWDLGWG